MKAIGKVISFIEFFSPKMAKELREFVVDRIMSNYSASFMEKVAIMGKLNRFLCTMGDEQARDIIKGLGIPDWASEKPFKGML